MESKLLKRQFHVQKMNKETSLTYYVYGEIPQLLLISGLHGNETGVINSVFYSLKNNLEVIPPFVFIPNASPTAAMLNTRENAYGHDLNRLFSFSYDIEAFAVMKLIESYSPFSLAISIHEDDKPFYFYHQGENELDMDLEMIRQSVVSVGVDLYSGLDDDPSIDPVLGYMVEQGYVKIPDNQVADGTLESWLLRQKHAQTIYTLEVPNFLEGNTKSKLCEIFFQQIVIKKAS